MAAAASTPRSSLGPTGSRSDACQTGLPHSAAVFDYTCLFTHDLKRKQKRWQDGRLKFHTFNKRVMVYDERGNFIGDMHWCEDWDFDEGEEFQLERGCVIVQVAECLGSKEQDLTELLEKRQKDKEQRQARTAAAVSASASSRPSQSSHRPLVPRQQPRQPPLSDLTTTPRGNQLGRAVIPKESPYEQRLHQQAQAQDSENARPAKRRKPDMSPPSKSGYAQSLFGATLSLSPWTSSAPQSQAVRHEAPLLASISHPTRAEPPSSRSRAPPRIVEEPQRPAHPTQESGPPLSKPESGTIHRVSPESLAQVAALTGIEKTRTRKQMPTLTLHGPVSRRMEKDPTKLTRGTVPDAPSELPSETTQTRENLEDEDGVVDVNSRPTSLVRKNKHKQKPSSVARVEPTEKPRNRKAASLESREVDRRSKPPDGVEDDEDRSRLVSRTTSARKRGLLMKSNKSKVHTRRSRDEATLPPISECRREDSDIGKQDARLKAIPFQSETQSETASPSLNDEGEPDAASGGTRSSKSRGTKRAANAATPSKEKAMSTRQPGSMDAETTTGPKKPAERGSRLKRPKQNQRDAASQSESDPFDEETALVENDSDTGMTGPPAQSTTMQPMEEHPFLPSGARLASFGRKSVKSKEILGFFNHNKGLQGESYFANTSPDQSSTLGQDQETVNMTNNVPQQEAHRPVQNSKRRASKSPQVGQADDEPFEAMRESNVSHHHEGHRPEAENYEADTTAPKNRRLDADEGPPNPATREKQSMPKESGKLYGKGNNDQTGLGQTCRTESEFIGKANDVSATKASNQGIPPGPKSPRNHTAVAVPDEAEHTNGGGENTSVTKPSHQTQLERTSTEGSSDATFDTEATKKAGQPARLVNPATRGRKAAQKSDAAGQVPQTVVPACPVAELSAKPRRLGAPMHSRGPVETTATEPNGQGSKATRLPGFASAGGGPWSKTAYDLLGIGRPSSE